MKTTQNQTESTRITKQCESIRKWMKTIDTVHKSCETESIQPSRHQVNEFGSSTAEADTRVLYQVTRPQQEQTACDECGPLQGLH